MERSIALMVAMGHDRAIGRDNKLMWSLREDMKLFREITKGKTVIMGRNTALSIGKPLPGRINIVVTSGEEPFEGVWAVKSLQDAIDRSSGDVVVIGGARLYEEALPLVDTMHISLVDGLFEDADVYFPPFDLRQFDMERSVTPERHSDEIHTFTFFTLKRVPEGTIPSWMAVETFGPIRQLPSPMECLFRAGRAPDVVMRQEIDKAFMLSMGGEVGESGLVEPAATEVADGGEGVATATSTMFFVKNAQALKQKLRDQWQTELRVIEPFAYQIDDLQSFYPDAEDITSVTIYRRPGLRGWPWKLIKPEYKLVLNDAFVKLLQEHLLYNEYEEHNCILQHAEVETYEFEEGGAVTTEITEMYIHYVPVEGPHKSVSFGDVVRGLVGPFNPTRRIEVVETRLP